MPLVSFQTTKQGKLKGINLSIYSRRPYLYSLLNVSSITVQFLMSEAYICACPGLQIFSQLSTSGISICSLSFILTYCPLSSYRGAYLWVTVLSYAVIRLSLNTVIPLGKHISFYTIATLILATGIFVCGIGDLITDSTAVAASISFIIDRFQVLRFDLDVNSSFSRNVLK